MWSTYGTAFLLSSWTNSWLAWTSGSPVDCVGEPPIYHRFPLWLSWSWRSVLINIADFNRGIIFFKVALSSTKYPTKEVYGDSTVGFAHFMDRESMRLRRNAPPRH
ncbi:hypothetical protein RvY_10922-4 [Ramazzottius varieornatus]|uniref:Secreted protein n=1 Tax=Ramazzottius varieornatus TaxID=947166 RepID=A0A1D1VEE1_RAMVA|nr:hypothetical protein RvY_10922-4 [Ramazzottius varieornatus]